MEPKIAEDLICGLTATENPSRTFTHTSKNVLRRIRLATPPHKVLPSFCWPCLATFPIKIFHGLQNCFARNVTTLPPNSVPKLLHGHEPPLIGRLHAKERK